MGVDFDIREMMFHDGEPDFDADKKKIKKEILENPQLFLKTLVELSRVFEEVTESTGIIFAQGADSENLREVLIHSRDERVVSLLLPVMQTIKEWNDSI